VVQAGFTGLGVTHNGQLTYMASRTAPCERELVRSAAAGDRVARDGLVENYLPLVATMARVYRSSYRVDRGELMQEGVVGLLRALERFDSSLGTPFWAYASWWVRQAMQQLVAETTRPLVLSDRALRQLARIKEAHRAHLQSRGGEPSTADLSAATGLTQDQVKRLNAAERTPRSLEESLGAEDGTGASFGDLLADPVAEDGYERVDQQLEVDDLRRLAEGLDDRERVVLYSHYGLDGPSQTLRQIAGTLGLSAERVRQIEERALGRLRDAAA
jgi:RNA polymerase primary sigma factor